MLDGALAGRSLGRTSPSLPQGSCPAPLPLPSERARWSPLRLAFETCTTRLMSLRSLQCVSIKISWRVSSCVSCYFIQFQWYRTAWKRNCLWPNDRRFHSAVRECACASTSETQWLLWGWVCLIYCTGTFSTPGAQTSRNAACAGTGRTIKDTNVIPNILVVGWNTFSMI